MRQLRQFVTNDTLIESLFFISSTLILFATIETHKLIEDEIKTTQNPDLYLYALGMLNVSAIFFVVLPISAFFGRKLYRKALNDDNAFPAYLEEDNNLNRLLPTPF